MTVQILSPEVQIKLARTDGPLEALTKLFSDLERQRIRYCHWKSNLRLDKSLRGETDLDLLVHKDDRDMFNRTLDEHDIKLLNPAAGKDYPGVENYLGFDPQSAKLFHLHVHYQLVLGEQFVKNTVLPFETLFIENTRMQRGIKVPCPELEIIILSIRALLKYRDRDVIKDILSIRSSGIPKHILDEIDWLLGQISRPNMAYYLDQVADVIPADIVEEFLETITHNPRNGYKLFSLRKQLRRSLQPYLRQSRLIGALKYYREAYRQIIPFHNASPNRKMTLGSGGKTIALIGADGSGKSSMSASLAKWLSWKLDVRLFYLGSKQPSLLSKTLYYLFRIARRGHRSSSHVLGETNPITRIFENLRNTLLYSHHLSTGHDRYRRYRAGCKHASKGSIVIYDRYPLEAPLDGPRIQPVKLNEHGPMHRVFYRLEEQLYQRIRPPEFCLVLNVSPEISTNRKPDHNPEVVAAKCKFINELGTLDEKKNGWNFIQINADLPYEDVYHQIKTTVWNVL
jgi:hypothetical protein